MATARPWKLNGTGDSPVGCERRLTGHELITCDGRLWPLAAFRRVVQRIGQGFEGQPFRRNGTSVNNASNAPLLPFQLHLSQLLGEGHSARPSFNSAAPSGCIGELNFDVVAVLCTRRAMSDGSL